MARSIIENHPQNGPKRSKISSAWPRWVAAPRRTVISWTTMAMQNVSATKGNEESNTKFRARSRVGEHAGPVVLTQHDQHSGPDQQPQQPRIGKKAALGASCGNADAILRPIHVLVRDDNNFVFAAMRFVCGGCEPTLMAEKLA